MKLRKSLFGYRHATIISSSLILFLISSTHIAQGQKESSLDVIVYPATFPKDVAADIQYLLQTSTGRRWNIQQGDHANQGVILSLNSSGNYKTGESCIINSDGSSYLKFQSATINGLIYGFYKYVRDLGFRFYLPDPLYTVIPPLKSIFKQTSSMETPFERIRDFFGTGGFGSGKTDPDRLVQNAWQLWKWRNGFGAEFHLTGHVGETFNLANAQTLAKNPSWTATPILVNGKVNPSTKLNYYNSAAVDFFTDWVISKFTKPNYQVPPPSLRDMVSIEPADGGGYLNESPAGSDLKTISDQVYNAANVAAAKLDRLFPNQPNIGVNLYTYSTHADLPNFALNPRVFVELVPYQYQTVASGPAFIKRWSEKVKRFGIYDYFKYPDSYWDLPGKFTLDELMKRAVNASEAGAEGFTYESSYSKFSTAIPLWVVCQYLCSGDPAWEKNYDRFIQDLYGTASPAIKDLFNIFYREAQFQADDLTAAVDDIARAQQLTKDPLILQRIDELKSYLAYVSLYLKSQDTSTGDLDQRLLALDKMIWTLYQSKIVDGYRLMQLISNSFMKTKTPDKALQDRYQKLYLQTFVESASPDVLWKKGFSYSPTEIDNIYQGAKGADISSRKATRDGDSPSLEQTISALDARQIPKPNVTFQGGDKVRAYFNLYARQAQTITVNWSLANQKDQTPGATISGSDNNLKTVYDFQLTGRSGKITISLVAGQSNFAINASPGTSYTLQLQLGNAYCYFEGTPRGKLNFLTPAGTPSYDPAYFPCFIYIPKNVTEVQYRVRVDVLKILDPQGKQVQTRLIKTSMDDFQLRSFSVPPNASGKFWQAIISGNNNYQFTNIPDRYFLLSRQDR